MVEQIWKILEFSFAKFTMFVVIEHHLDFVALNFVFLLLGFSSLIV